MRNYVLLLLAVLLFSCSNNKTENVKVFKLGKGTNLAHWLSQSKNRGAIREAFITKKDIEYIAS